MLAGVEAVTVIVTDTGDEVPFTFVAWTLKMYVPATVGRKLSVELAVGVAATGVCAKATAGPVPPARDQAKVGLGCELVVASTVTGNPAVTVWFWIALIEGAGAAATVIVEVALCGPHTFVAVNVTK